MHRPLPFSPVVLLLLASLLIALPLSYAEDDIPLSGLVEDLTGGGQWTSDPSLAATSPEQVTAGWCVERGPGAGIYLRSRVNFLWDAESKRIPAEPGASPRDLFVLYDPQGSLHVAWTALIDGYRNVHYMKRAATDTSQKVWTLGAADLADADYPRLAATDAGGIRIAWQAGATTFYTIEAAASDSFADGFVRLPRVSGSTLAAMTPQLLSALPFTVAWYDVLETGNELRISQWDSTEQRWFDTASSSTSDNRMAWLPPDQQAVVATDPSGADFACWADFDDLGRSLIAAARSTDQPTEVPELQILEEPDGDHRRPHLAIGGDQALTLSWQIFSEDEQIVRAACLDFSGASPQVATVSPATHRFASEPWHVSQGRWTAVLWTDDYREGGSGAVGFAELEWLAPEPRALEP